MSKFQTIELTSYSKPDGSGSKIQSMIAGANPDSISMKLSDASSKSDPSSDEGQASNRSPFVSESVSFKLQLDGTGVLYESDLEVYQQASLLKFLCFNPVEDGVNKLKPFIRIEWGQTFQGGLTKNKYIVQADSLTVNYTLFSKNGNPLRAEVDFSGKLHIPNEDVDSDQKESKANSFFHDIELSLSELNKTTGEDYTSLREKVRSEKYADKNKKEGVN